MARRQRFARARVSVAARTMLHHYDDPPALSTNEVIVVWRQFEDTIATVGASLARLRDL
jgi:hypothetical protein